MSDLRQRIIDTAAELTVESGWSAVTMSALAARVGVSRQTVYNEAGSKPELAEAMVLDELGRFLALVEAAFDRHPDDAEAAIRRAANGVLTRARDNPLLRAIVSASQGADTELLPLLTTQSGALRAAAHDVLRARLAPLTPADSVARLDTVVDVLVRLVLSQVMQPSGSPRSTADGLAWTTRQLLAH